MLKLHLRDGDLCRGVVVEAEGATLQHLEAKALTLVSIDIHEHDRQGKLSCILHLETLSDGEQRLVGAQTWEWHMAELRHLWHSIQIKDNITWQLLLYVRCKQWSHHRDTPLGLTEERWSAARLPGPGASLQSGAALWPRGPEPSPCRTRSGCSWEKNTHQDIKLPT